MRILLADVAKAMLRDTAMERCLVLTSASALMLMFSRSVELGVATSLRLVQRFLRVKVETVCLDRYCFNIPSTKDFICGVLSSVLHVASFMVCLSVAAFCLSVFAASYIFCRRFKDYTSYVAYFIVGSRGLALASATVYAVASFLASVGGSLAGYAVALLMCRVLDLVSNATLPVYMSVEEVLRVSAATSLASTMFYIIAYCIVRR